jgi:hypothetical protein
MKESYGEGLATHADPESCVAVREDGDEALTGALAGQALSREIHAPPRGGFVRGADVVEIDGRPHRERRHREAPTDPARSETLSTQGNTSHGNREIPRPSVAAKVADRIGKSKDTRR